MSLKPFQQLLRISATTAFATTWTISTACRQVKDQDFPLLLDVVKEVNTYEKAHISQVLELFKLILV